MGISIPEISVKFFSDNATSQLKGVEVAKVKQALLGKGHIKDGRWVAFKSDTAKSTDEEEKSLVPLTDVITKIYERSGLGETSKRTMYMHSPNSTSESVLSNSTCPVAATLSSTTPINPRSHKGPTNSTISWDEIMAVPTQFKKKANVHKIVWSLHHVLRSDPCQALHLPWIFQGKVVLLMVHYRIIFQEVDLPIYTLRRPLPLLSRRGKRPPKHVRFAFKISVIGNKGIAEKSFFMSWLY
ncbi:hypothetical protein SERLA73DRAFT_156090 [Serpula lacrymans var. lacrymans S7.3]|uniref:Fungal-type protein kinase domain-containing protein n=1 Tax=Serpula lacrymans var. lacrymans (strain S7.3) TaxID=936435 RepID=F8QCV9_SERL3|nr:hypothetical protein SERLA73DRAFT_156090 [Serpula lacrymans var. lacrymans S7.3]